MHSFHPSRGRILFEVLCALAISASCAGAWLQTGATALLGVAAVAALYGVIHLFDLKRPEPAVAYEPQLVEFEPQPIMFEPAAQSDVATRQDARVLLAAIDQQFASEEPVVARSSAEEVEPAEPAAPKSNGGRQAKASRKGSGRRASTSKKAKVEEVALPSEADVTETPLYEEVHHAPLAPLFEPEPFARMQRPAFGRRAGFGRKG